MFLRNATIYDFDPEDNYRELKTKKKILKLTLKIKQSLENRRRQSFTSLFICLMIMNEKYDKYEKYDKCLKIGMGNDVFVSIVINKLVFIYYSNTVVFIPMFLPTFPRGNMQGRLGKKAGQTGTYYGSFNLKG